MTVKIFQYQSVANVPLPPPVAPATTPVSSTFSVVSIYYELVGQDFNTLSPPPPVPSATPTPAFTNFSAVSIYYVLTGQDFNTRSPIVTPVTFGGFTQWPEQFVRVNKPFLDFNEFESLQFRITFSFSQWPERFVAPIKAALQPAVTWYAPVPIAATPSALVFTQWPERFITPFIISKAANNNFLPLSCFYFKPVFAASFRHVNAICSFRHDAFKVYFFCSFKKFSGAGIKAFA